MKIDKKKDKLLADYAVGMLKDFYLNENEKSPQEAYARAATAWSSTYEETLDEDLAQRLYHMCQTSGLCLHHQFYRMHLTEPRKVKGCLSHCFLTYVPDTLEGLIGHSSELRWLSVYGGGVGGHWSDVRTVSDVAPGPMPFFIP